MISNLKIYNVSSEKAMSGKSHDFYYNFNFNQTTLKDLTHCCVTEISLPKSYYNFRSGFSKFTIIENDEYIDMEIAHGNYTKKQFYMAVQSLLNTNTKNGVTYQVQDQYSDHDSGKMVIIADKANIKKVLHFGSSHIRQDCPQAFGCRYGTDYEFENNVQFTSPGVINLNKENGIYLLSDIGYQDYNDPNLNSCAILLTLYGQNQKYMSYIQKSFNIESNMINFSRQNKPFRFFITDENLNPIDLNDIPLTFKIVFFTYTPNKLFYEKINDYIDYNVLKKMSK